MGNTLLRFSAGNDPISWMIQQRTGCSYSHVDFLVGDRLLGALPGGGVQYRDCIKREKRFAIYEVPVKDGYHYCFEQIGKPYDYIAVVLLGLPFPRNWKDDTRWYCSEIVAASLLSSGCAIASPDAWGITPRDLLFSPLLKRVG